MSYSKNFILVILGLFLVGPAFAHADIVRLATPITFGIEMYFDLGPGYGGEIETTPPEYISELHQDRQNPDLYFAEGSYAYPKSRWGKRWNESHIEFRYRITWMRGTDDYHAEGIVENMQTGVRSQPLRFQVNKDAWLCPPHLITLKESLPFWTKNKFTVEFGNSTPARRRGCSTI